jgi:formyl-CoA transferase
MQVVREHQFERLAELVGRPDWLEDPRLSTRAGWAEHLETEIRPAVEKWMATRTRMEAVHELSAAGIAAGPCLTPPEVVDDPHVAARHMLVPMERTDGVPEPVLVPGNPVKLAGHDDPAEAPGARVPWVGEHTESVLRDELGLGEDDLDALARAGAIDGLERGGA